jgi:hypothetical protein
MWESLVLSGNSLMAYGFKKILLPLNIKRSFIWLAQMEKGPF